MDTLITHDTDQGHPCPGAPEIIAAAVEQVLPVYQRCLDCAYLGKTCVGPHMSELGGTDAVRGYHRLLRAARNISVNKIHQAAQQIGHGTITDYFGRGGSQDFKLTTVLAIDRALVAICGNRVGQPPLDGFCPADAADLRDRSEALVSRLNEAEAEIARLTELLRNAEAASDSRIGEFKAVYQSQINLILGQKDAAEARADDYLQRLDRKSAQIEELHKENRRLNADILRMASAYAAESKGMVDRVIKLAETHEDDFRKMQFGISEE
jgi:HPt (histidine-containing phosphotransfer) domain-containing protein